MTVDRTRTLGKPAASRFPWTRRRPATAHLTTQSDPQSGPQSSEPLSSTEHASPIVHTAPNAVDPLLVAEPLDRRAAVERGKVALAATLTSPLDGSGIAGATVLFQVSVAARTPIKCQALTDANGVARTESTLPAGMFDRGLLEYRVSFTGAMPSYWPVSVSGDIV